MKQPLPEAQATPQLAPLQPPRSLTDEVVTILRARILAGDFTSGQQLVQAEVARMLGVSRGPVREALNQLKAEGLVHEEPRRGTFVRRPEPAEVRDALDLRLALEIRAAHLVIDRTGSGSLTPIREALEHLVRAVGNRDQEGIGGADFAFHNAICVASGNRLLHSVFANQAQQVMVLLQVDELAYSTRPQVLIDEHRELFECLEGGDKTRMQQLLTDHIEGVRDRLLRTM